jgi:hypothetical protein
MPVVVWVVHIVYLLQVFILRTCFLYFFLIESFVGPPLP